MMQAITFCLAAWVLTVSSAKGEPKIPDGHAFRVVDYGAVGDGIQDDTVAIQKAIDAQHAAGKGHVLLAAGKVHLISTIVLKDKNCLYLQEGTRLKGMRDTHAYPVMKPAGYKALRVFARSMVYAEGAKHVKILGSGVIDANGQGVKGNETQRWNSLRFVNCSNVEVRDITLTNSCMWPQLYSRVSHLVIDGVKVEFTDQINTDGLNIDGCQQVEIRNCRIDSEDDGIVLKTLSQDHPIRDVFIHDNVVTSRNASGLKLGTETHGDIENVRFRNNRVTDCGGRAGGAIVILAVDGGNLKDILFEDIEIDRCFNAITIRLGSRNRSYKGQPVKQVTTSTIDGVTLRKIRASNISKGFECWISGIPGHRVRNITFDNVHIESTANGRAADRGINPPEKETAYPDPDMFGNLPAFGLYARHAENITLKDCSFRCGKDEKRYAMVIDDVTGDLILENVLATSPDIEQRGGSSFRIEQARDDSANMFRLTSGRSE